MGRLTGRVGFDHPIAEKRPLKQRVVALELAATVALAVSLAIAATAVSIGMARADTLALTDSDGAPFAVALFLSLVIAGMGGLTAIMARERAPRD